MIEHNEIEADHISFLVGKDMSYFDRVKEVLDLYSPLEKYKLENEFLNLL